MQTIEQAVTIDQEAKFDINELFFSITSKDSTIVSGNEVFVRISGYTKQELIGSFHNIIRHPDMPKIVFKTLWDYLNAGKPIVAYVKNRTKEGRYYWVLAVVFPLNDRYVSIRIKPNTPIFTAVKELYSKLLMAENKGGTEASGNIFPALLSNAGYENYDQFMSDAFLQELQGRQGLISRICHREQDEEPSSPLLDNLKSVHTLSKKLMDEYDQWFEKIAMFTEIKSMFEEKGLILGHLARDIVFLSLNASVSSYKIASGGETFGILARDIRTNAKENDTLINEMHEIVNNVSNSLSDIIFVIASMRLQIEMVTYFIEEISCNHGAMQSSEMNGNICDLIALIVEYTGKTKTSQLRLDGEIQESLKHLDQLEQQMMYLGYIQVYGFMEAAASYDESVRFKVIFSQLKILVEQTSQEIDAMQKNGKSFYRENRRLMEKSTGIDRLLNYLQEEMMIIKEMEGQA
ncbi:MAG: PAS domain-containing protein [Sulfuricurvum sp.]|nr:PAS domain-containing protein [Sulfuricurvum sp.]